LASTASAASMTTANRAGSGRGEEGRPVEGGGSGEDDWRASCTSVIPASNERMVHDEDRPAILASAARGKNERRESNGRRRVATGPLRNAPAIRTRYATGARAGVATLPKPLASDRATGAFRREKTRSRRTTRVENRGPRPRFARGTWRWRSAEMTMESRTRRCGVHYESDGDRGCRSRSVDEPASSE